MRLLLPFLLAGALLATGGGAAAAQTADSVTIAAGPRYRTGGPLGWLVRWVFGSRHRDLWSTPIRVERLDPERFRGGLTLLGADSGMRAGYRYYRDAAGETWTFRAIDRDLTSVLPERLRDFVLAGFLQDLYSGLHPGAALVAPQLARAAGVGVHLERLVGLVEDSAITTGYLQHGVDTRFREALDDPGTAISTAELAVQLEAPIPPPVDTIAYLRERLFDLYVASWDPLPQEWLWVRRGDAWRPMARDRDGAFARFNGLGATLAAASWAELSRFGKEYEGKLPVTSRTRILDRQLLTGLDPLRWDPVAREIQGRLTDSALVAAVNALPPPWRERNGPWLLERLKGRRERLPMAAYRFRQMLEEEAEVYGTGGPDQIIADFRVDSVVDVIIPGRFRRIFHRDETREVRIYGLGGADHVTVRGAGVFGPRLRIAVDDNMSVADSSLTRRAEESADLSPPRFLDEPDVPLVSGLATGFVPWISLSTDIGFLGGGGVVVTGYDPRFHPWQSRSRLRVGYATGPAAFGAVLESEFRFSGTPARLRVNARASGLEILKFYGYGNETERPEEKRFYRTDQQHLVFAPSVAWPMSDRLTFEAGPVVKLVTTGFDRENLLVQLKPYGVSDRGFGQVGGQASLEYDTRDSRVFARTGWLARVGLTGYPAAFDVTEAFGMVEGSVAGTASPSSRLTLAARASARTTWGRYPVHEAAYLGGSRSVRSLSAQRFAGDAAVWGNLDLRYRVGSVPFVMQWDFGLLGVADIGRVFLEGERSRTWHHGLGGGLWASLPDRSFLALFDVVAGDDGLAFWAGTAFIF